MAMTADVFQIWDIDTDEMVAEAKARPGSMYLAKIYLFGGREPKSGPEMYAQNMLWAFLCAHWEGKLDIPEVENPRKLSVERVLDLCNRYTLQVPGAEEEPDEDPASEDEGANPTEPAPELS